MPVLWRRERAPRLPVRSVKSAELVSAMLMLLMSHIELPLALRAWSPGSGPVYSVSVVIDQYSRPAPLLARRVTQKDTENLGKRQYGVGGNASGSGNQQQMQPRFRVQKRR